MNHVAILAAGNGIRSGVPHKLYENIAGKSLIYQSIKTFYSHPQIDSVVVVIRESDHNRIQNFLGQEGLERVECVIGGETRQQSAAHAYRYLERQNRLSQSDFFFFHHTPNPLFLFF